MSNTIELQSMTKDGYKQVMLSIDTYTQLDALSKKHKISMNKLILTLLKGIKSPTLCLSKLPARKRLFSNNVLPIYTFRSLDQWC